MQSGSQKRFFGPDDSDSLSAQSTLAGIYSARGNTAAAERLFRRILHRLEARPQANPYEVALAAGNLGAVHLANAKNSEAVKMLTKSRTGLCKSPVTTKDEILHTEAYLALAYARDHRSTDARLLLRDVLASVEAVLGGTHPAYAAVIEILATASLALGDRDSSRDLFGRALRSIEWRRDASSPGLTEAMQRFADILESGKDSKGAKQMRDRLATSLVRSDR